MSEHEFVAFGVVTESEVDEAVFFFRFADEVAAVLFNEFNAFADIVALEAESGPGAFPFTSAVDSEGRTAKSELTPDLHLKGEIGAKGFLVELDGAEMVGGPEGILHFLDLHAECLTQFGGWTRQALHASNSPDETRAFPNS